MEIGNINNYGEMIIADKIEKIVYNENLGIDKEEFGKLKETLKNLSQDKQAQLIQMSGELTDTAAEQKPPIIERIQTFLYENGVPIAHSLTAAGIFELARVFMP